MTKICVTGFRPYSLLTRLRGNPSELVAREVAARAGTNVSLHTVEADATCLPAVEALGKQEWAGIVMLGANLQIHPVQLELEGAEVTGLLSANRVRSTAAEQMAGFARGLGVAVGTAPPRPLVYWCLRSYAAALSWAEPRGIPCIFLHLGTVGFATEALADTVMRFVDQIGQKA